MSGLQQQIEKMDENELNELIEIINDRLENIRSENYIKNIIPDLFKNHIKYISFNTSTIEDFDEVVENQYNMKSNGQIIFNDKLKIIIYYDLYGSNITHSNIMIYLVIDNHKHRILYDYDYEWIEILKKLVRKIFLYLDKTILEVLCGLGLEINSNNKNILGVLIHNIIFQSKMIFEHGLDSDKHEQIINNYLFDEYDGLVNVNGLNVSYSFLYIDDSVIERKLYY